MVPWEAFWTTKASRLQIHRPGAGEMPRRPGCFKTPELKQPRDRRFYLAPFDYQMNPSVFFVELRGHYFRVDPRPPLVSFTTRSPAKAIVAFFSAIMKSPWTE